MVAVLPSGTKLTPARLALVARKTADEIVNNSATLQNDDALFLAVPASAVYRFELNLRYNTNSTANIKWAFTQPAGSLLAYSALHVPAGGTALALTGLVNAGSTADDSLGFVRMLGHFETAATAGTLQLQWAQNTANASNTIVQSTAYMRLDRVA